MLIPSAVTRTIGNLGLGALDSTGIPWIISPLNEEAAFVTPPLGIIISNLKLRDPFA